MSDNKITLYDLAQRTAPNKCWSYNVWKTRMALNYKNMDYSTHWLDHNTLTPTLKSLGVPPNTSPQSFEYTVPTVKMPDKTAVTDSAVIAVKLEEMSAESTLGLNAELEGAANGAVHKAVMPLFAIYMPRVAREVVREDTVAVFTASREKRFGVPLEEFERTKGGENAWKAAEPGFAAIKALLTERKTDQGPFILGSQVCYADFIVVAMFEALKRAGGDLFERAVGYDACFRAVYDACGQWIERDE